MKVPTIMVVVVSLLTAAIVSVVPVNVNASTAHIGVIEKRDGSLREWTSAQQSEVANARHSFSQEPNDGTEPAATVEIHTPGVDKEVTSAGRDSSSEQDNEIESEAE